jgi:YidC/Oxa1 family membrane protein insertase
MHNDEPRMELRALIAVILSMAVLATYQYFFVPPVAPEAGLAADQPGAATPAPPAVASGVEPGPGEAPIQGETATAEGAPSAAAIGADQETQVTISAENYRVELTNVGGRIRSMVLPAYRGDLGAELDLVSAAATAAARLPLEWVGAAGTADELLNSALFQVQVLGGSGFGNDRAPTPDSPVVVSLDWSDGAGRSASKEITFPAAGNIIEVRASATGFGPLLLGLGAGLDEVPVGLRNAYLAENAMVYGAEGLDKWGATDLESAVTVEGPLWAGVESHYFMAAFLLDGDQSTMPRALLSATPVQVPAAADAEDPNPVDHIVPAIALAIEATASGTPIYFGPKKYDYLIQQGHALEQAVDFGIWGFVSRPLLWVLNTIYSVVGNWGIAIILLTAMLRLAFWPLNQKAMTSMRKTQKLQPQMSAIRGKYKGVKDLDKRQQMNEEVMALYKREGVSPLGGCLPMLAQIPILFSFYALLSVAIELRQAHFVFWITDLSRHDPYLVLPLLMGASMLAQQRLTPQTAADPQQASMMRMMRLMPIFFTVMFLYVPSGLVLYWLVNNLLGIGQQLYVNRSMDRQLLAEKATKKAAKGGKSQRGK